ncbi:proline-rich protein 11 isoform X2 [Phascolarctos cinereus]
MIDSSPTNSCSGQICPTLAWSKTFSSMKNLMKFLAEKVWSFYWYCQSNITQNLEMLKDLLFPSRIYFRELSMIRQQVGKLENEFCKFQEALKTSASERSSCQDCHKTCHLRTPLPENFAEAQTTIRELASTLPPVTLKPVVILPPPPPPPPPPLPPPPPRRLPLHSAPLLLQKADSTKTLQTAPLKQDVPMHITVKDLLTVKLKKTQSSTHRSKNLSSPKERKPLVTVSDLQSISLKPQSKFPSTHITNVIFTPRKGQVDLRKLLRKVNIDRSPGGTPLINKENMETGTGLTPIMTKALRQKFQLAHPKSPSQAPLLSANGFEE